MMHDGKSFHPFTGKIGGGPCDAVEDAAQAVVDIKFRRCCTLASNHFPPSTVNAMLPPSFNAC